MWSLFWPWCVCVVNYSLAPSKRQSMIRGRICCIHNFRERESRVCIGVTLSLSLWQSTDQMPTLASMLCQCYAGHTHTAQAQTHICAHTHSGRRRGCKESTRPSVHLGHLAHQHVCVCLTVSSTLRARVLVVCLCVCLWTRPIMNLGRVEAEFSPVENKKKLFPLLFFWAQWWWLWKNPSFKWHNFQSLLINVRNTQTYMHVV